VTNLTNRAMPLLRYESGDLAAWADGPCPCGSTLPRLAAVYGRVCEVILCPSGKLLHSAFFSGVMRGAGGVQGFQMVQRSREDLLVRFVPLPGTDIEQTQARVRRLIAERGDPAFRVTFEVYDEGLPTSSSGKHRFVVSLLDELPQWAPKRPTSAR